MQLSYWDQYVIRLSPRESLEKVALRLRIDRLKNVTGVWEILTWNEKGENQDRIKGIFPCRFIISLGYFLSRPMLFNFIVKKLILSQTTGVFLPLK